MHIGTVSVVIVSVTMTVAMVTMVVPTVAMAMRMTVIEGKDANEVDDQAEEADEQEALRVHLGWVQDTLDGLHHNRNADQNQEHAVEEGSDGLDAVVPEHSTTWDEHGPNKPK